MNRFTGLLLPLLLLMPAAGLVAQDTPRTAAEAYLAAMQAADWERASELTHPAALADLKTVLATLAASDTAGEMLEPLFGVHSAVEFDRLTAVQVYTRLLQRVGAREQVADAMRQMEMRILGEIPEEPDLVHVVYRVETRLEEGSMSRVQVLTLRREGQRWLALLNGDVRGLAEVLSEMPR